MVAKSENIRNTTDKSQGFDYHNGMAFSTSDRDQDSDARNCAAMFGGGGWWYRGCFNMNLNGNKSTSDKNDQDQMAHDDGSGYKMMSASEMKMVRVTWLEQFSLLKGNENWIT